MTHPPKPGKELRKDALGFFEVYGIMVSIMVASSTIAFLPLGWDVAGPAFLVSIFIAACNATLVGLNFIELALMFPRASSFVDYFRFAFGEWAGIGFALNYVVVLTLAGAGSFVVIGDFFHQLVTLGPWWGWGIGVYAVLLVVHLLGVEVFGWSEFLMALSMILSLLIISGLVLGSATRVVPDWSVFSTFWHAGPTAVWSGSLLAVWMFVGFEVTGPLIEEVKQPRRTLPWALCGCIGTVMLTLMLFYGAQLTTTDLAELVGSSTPHIRTGSLAFGFAGVMWLTGVSILAEGSSVNSAIGGNSRLLYALGRLGAVPAQFGQVNARFRTPWISLTVITGAMVGIGLWAGHDGFLVLFKIATFMWLMSYFLFCLTVVLLRIRIPDRDRPFSVGGPRKLPFLSLLGLIIMSLIFWFSPQRVSFWGVVILVSCCLYGYVMQWLPDRN